MAVLTRETILSEIKKGQIKITPFNPKNIGPASIDISLGNKFRIFDKSESAIKLSEQTDYKKFTTLKKADKGIIIWPGQALLGITKEKIKLPPDICARLQGRTRFARLGLMVHLTASFLQPGINSHQVLEMFNAGSKPLEIKPGLKICTIILERCEGSAQYKGKFANQRL